MCSQSLLRSLPTRDKSTGVKINALIDTIYLKLEGCTSPSSRSHKPILAVIGRMLSFFMTEIETIADEAQFEATPDVDTYLQLLKGSCDELAEIAGIPYPSGKMRGQC